MTKLSMILMVLWTAKSNVIVALGALILSTLEWLMSLSCQEVIFSRAGMAKDLTTLVSPETFSDNMGFFL